MKIINSKTLRLAFLLGVMTLISAGPAFAGDDLQGPVLPAACTQIEVPQGQALISHTYAIGVQIYRWSGVRWDLVAPAATLFGDEDLQEIVGNHFGGPTWMSNDGSSVVAARVDGCTPDVSAVPWLLLKATSKDGDGPFGRTSYIQRVNTAGGLAPLNPGYYAGSVVRVPYRAEYYFYQATQN